MILRRTVFALLGIVALTAGPVAFSQSPSPAHDLRIGQILKSLEQVRAIQQTDLSPDGNLIAWNAGGIEVAPLNDPSHPRSITACTGDTRGRESGFAWSPDSKTLAFFSNCTTDHKPAIFLADLASNAAPRLLAPLNGFAKDLQWSPDGKLLSFLYVEGATRPSGALAAMKPPSGVIGVEGLEIQRVAAVDPVSGTISQITPANLHVYEFDWAPDSKNLAFIAAPPPGENNWWVAKLYTQTLSASPQVLVDPDSGASSVHGLQIAVPRWSPDGSQIAFIGGLMSDQGSTGGDIYVIASMGREAKNVTPGLTTSPAWLRWKSNTEIQFTEIASGTSRLNHLELPAGTSDDETTSDFVLPETIGSGGLSMSLSFADNGAAAMIRSSFNQPPEVWIWTPKPNPANRHFSQITAINSDLKPSWGNATTLEWTNEGFRVDGWLLYPANYDPAKKYPLIVVVHGGPSSAVLPRWPGAGFGGAPFSALGYFVLEPNPRGSYGEGEKFTQANRKDFGYGDLHDILAGVDIVTRKYSVDPEKVGITGWSYGGFMTMFAVTQTNRFRAAVAGAGISNWQSYYGENSIDQWMIPFFGASVYDDPAVYAKSSAIDFIKRVKTPTLVVVGDRDGECPAPQSFEFWHALRDQHVPTQLVVYPNEGHGFVDPDHRRDVLERALAWFQEYMP
jgi:dipeptidyl aminopeptidase/acylaminoacyl peptidase